ncbi:4-amino-4-deoxychorismate lyase [Scopulibacillus darangshiensis]|uniref:4-amino-4-deoxychorismate lyase n=1 Tax=Scopulibacillus darangshiensis TaxID=442528 RepID=A0A4R2N9U7_9BACL|nr:aminodeoxychorismate lyase [Scopulibacillus darangshiensis]TCP17764.1 4-amino-4-deoxychorismate lyase [Scopulibacillus darangshiensis]
MKLYINGEYLDERDVRISPFDHGFLYGLGAFETFRTYNGKPVLFHRHWLRLASTLEQLGIRLNVSKEDMFSAISALLKINGLSDGRFRLNISAGESSAGLNTEYYMDPTVILFVNQLQEQPKTKTAKWLRVRRNTPEGDVRIKSHHYLNNILGKRELLNEVNVEGLFLNEEGFITEGIVSNVFWVKNKVLYTPAVDTGLLAGITRDFVIECAGKIGVRVQEGYFLPSEIENADEAFITNSIQEIMPLTAIEGYALPGDKGTVTQELIKQMKQAIIDLELFLRRCEESAKSK